MLHADGHAIASIAQAFGRAAEYKNSPVVIIAKTVRGKGVSFMEGQNAWHGKPISDEEYAQAKTELGGATA